MKTRKRDTPNPRIIDTTLREGAQAYGVRFGPNESAEIALALLSLGVDMVECGHPKIGYQEIQRVRTVVSVCGAVPVLAHARANIDDIKSVKATGALWVGIFAGINEISCASRIQTARPILSLIKEAIVFAKQLGLRVRFTVEDGSRTSTDKLIEAYKMALEAGADRIGFADTVGSLCSWEVEDIIRQLRCKLDDPDIEVHFHDDRGMAAANALSAVRAGARWVSSSINGIGERSGITDTLTLLVNLHALKWRSLQNGHGIPYASSLVQTHARLPVDKWRPIVGHNSFTHVAKLHRRAMLRDERTYTWIDPSLFGRVNSFGVNTLPPTPTRLIQKPKLLSSVEIGHHRRGPGGGYFFLDERAATDSRQYCIVRRIPTLKDDGPKHVDRYRHSVDSICLFLGNEDDLRGLSVEVFLDNETFIVNSPSSVFIPSGMMHSYKVVKGEGLFVNHVLVGDYNSSLPGSLHISSLKQLPAMPYA